MSYSEITDAQIDAESPLDTTLMGQLRDNALPYKIIDIGDWNMDADPSVAVAHGLTLANIRAVNATIRNDADSIYRDMPFVNYSSSNTSTQGIGVGTTNVTLTRATGGIFDTTAYDATSFNRGWITIWYVIP